MQECNIIDYVKLIILLHKSCNRTKIPLFCPFYIKYSTENKNNGIIINYKILEIIYNLNKKEIIIYKI